MSKARLVITAVVEEGRSQAEVAREYGVSKGWVSKLVARYRAEGESAFEPRSRRPHHSPRALPADTIEQVILERDRLVASGHDAGPHTIRWHLAARGLRVSAASIHRVLSSHGRVVPQPQKRPRSSYVRFEADQPNECWQSDFTHYRLTDGTDVEIITWLDDHSRYALHVSAHPRVTGRVVLNTFRAARTAHGVPYSTLTDNGMVYTVRLASHRVRGGRNALETELAALGVIQKNSRPNHPTTCGKVERFQQTLKNWLRAQPDQPTTIAQLQTLLDRFTLEYNTQRPHRSLRRATPEQSYTARPKATVAAEPTDRTHARVRHDKVDKTGKVTLRHGGRLYSIALGRAWTGTEVTMRIHGLNIRITTRKSSQLIRQLTLDPNRRYQPLTPAPASPTKTKLPEPCGFGEFPMS
jgi:transposase InsO family protein